MPKGASTGRPQISYLPRTGGRSIVTGSGADRVREYQEALAKHGYYRGAIDGAYGPNARAALAACLEAGCRLLE